MTIPTNVTPIAPRSHPFIAHHTLRGKSGRGASISTRLTETIEAINTTGDIASRTSIASQTHQGLPPIAIPYTAALAASPHHASTAAPIPHRYPTRPHRTSCTGFGTYGSRSNSAFTSLHNSVVTPTRSGL